MATPKILIKRSNVAGRVPTSLDSGELALNTADGKIYYTGHDGAIHAFMDSAGVNTLINNSVSTLDSGNVTDMIDSNYIQTRQITYTLPTLGNDFVDSAQVQAIINAAYVKNIIDSAYVASIVETDGDITITITNEITSTVDSAYVQARVDATDFLDSAEALALIDSDYILARADSAYIKTVTGIDADLFDGQNSTFYRNYNNLTNRPTILDNVDVQNQIDSDYVRLRQDFRYSSLTGKPNILDSANVVNIINSEGLDSDLVTALVDSAYISLRDRFQDSSLVTSTVDAAYVQARQIKYLDSEAVKAITLDSSEISTVVTSGYVQARQDFAYGSLTGTPTALSDFTNDVITSTSDVSEGSRLYFTNDRVRAISLDSEDATNLIDSAYIQARQTTGTGTDSAATIALITSTVDSAYVQLRETAGAVLPSLGNDFVDSAEALKLIDANALDSGRATSLIDSSYITARAKELENTLTITSTDAGSAAGPELILYRNSASPADADYLGQIQFKGRHDGPGDEVYAKVTGKIADASSGTEDGLIETAVKGNGSFTIVSRQRSNELQLLNGVGLSVDGSLTLGSETVDSSWVQARQDYAYGSLTGTPTIPVLGTDFVDSNQVTLIVDSAYVRIRVPTDQDLRTTSDVEFNKVNSVLDGAIQFTAKNTSGATLTKGTVVYISGVSGTTPTVDKADADDASKMPAFGIVAADASNNSNVNVFTFGTLTGIDTSSFSAGDTLFVSTTAGELTNVKPAGEASLLQNIGRVIRSHASAGSIKVGGAGRTNAVPNLDNDQFFLGNDSNYAVAVDFTTTVQGVVDSAYVQLRQDFAYSSLTGAPTIPTIDTDFVDSARVLRMISNEALDSDLTIALVDSAYIQLRDRFQDSSLVTSTVNQSYVRNLETPNPVLGTDFIDSAQALILIDANALDSGRATSLIDSAYVELRQKKGSLYIAVSNDATAAKPYVGNNTNSIAIGVNANTDATRVGFAGGGNGAIAIGDSATTTGHNTIAIGHEANTGLTGYHINGVAIGYQAHIDSGNRATVVGSQADARGNNTTAIGANAEASGTSSLALGSAARATHDYSVAVGRSARSRATNQMILGADDGTNDITSIQPGYMDYEPADSLDLVTKRYVDSQITLVIDSAYVQARQSATLSLGTDFIDSAQANILINSIVDSNGLNFIRVKSGSTEEPIISGHSGVGIGNNAKSTGNYGTAIGYNPEASTNSVAIGGFGAKAQSTYSVAIGDRAVTSSGHNYSVALGKAAETTAANQIMLGAKDNSLFRVTSVRIGNPNYEPTDSMDVPTKKYVDSQITTVIDSAYITSRETAQDFAYGSLTGTPTIPALGTDFVDSTQALILIDANALDSGRATSLIDSAYIELRRPPEAVFGVTNSVPGYYDFDGDGFSSTAQNPDIYLQRGKTYKFEVNASGHPFQIRSSAGGSAYNTGVTNNGAATGNILFTPDFSAPDVLFYQCTAHSNMIGRIYIFDVNTFVDSAFVTSRIPALGTDFIDSAQALILIDANALDSARATSLITSSYIQSRQSLIDSALTTSLIDSAYVQARTTAGTDSSATIALIEATVDSAYVQLREAAGGGGGGIDSAATIALIDSNYVQARQAAAAIDSALTLDLVRANSLDSAQSLALFSAHGMTVNTFVYTADSIGKLVYEGADDNSNVMSFTKASKNFRVSLNGILLIDSDDFTAVDNKITLVDAPNVSDILSVETFSGTQGVGGMSTFRYTATAGQLTFSGSDVNSSNLNYKPGDLIVSLNGIILIDSAEYTATDGTSIVLNDSAAVNDELLISTFTPDIERKWTERSASISVGSNTKNIVDCSGGAITITFPLSPVFGDEIRVIDGTGNAATNNITINRNGNKIQGATDNFIIDVNRAAVGFVYYNAAQGWILIEN